MNGMGVPNVGPDPAKLLHVGDRAAAEVLDAELFLVARLGKVGVKRDTEFSRKIG